MATLLAIDTATEACSVALLVNDDVSEEYAVAPRQHTRLILPMVDRLLAGAGMTLSSLDCLAFGRGPGAFTGVRLAAGVVQGLAFATDLPVVAISNLAALAQGVMDPRATPRVIACLDARMNEVYAGFFVAGEAGLAEPAGREVVLPPADLALPDQGEWFGVGPGWRAYPQLVARFKPLLTGLDGDRLPRARDVAVLGHRAFRAGEAVPADQALPVYLRDRVARPKVS